MRNKIEKGVDLNLRQFIKSLGYIAGGTALLASTPWLSSCTPEKLKEIRNEKARIALIGRMNLDSERVRISVTVIFKKIFFYTYRNFRFDRS